MYHEKLKEMLIQKYICYSLLVMYLDFFMIFFTWYTCNTKGGVLQNIAPLKNAQH